MIWKSSYWKSDLIKDANILKRWAIKKASIKQEVLFEKKIMLSAYAIRKLIEAEKIGSDIKYWDITSRKFPIKDSNKQPDLMNWHRFSEFYNIGEQVEKMGITLKNLCDWIVHSFIFCLTVDSKDCVDGFLVTSDKEKGNGLYWINLGDFITVLIGIGSSDIHASSMCRNIKKSSGWAVERKYVYTSIKK